MLPFHHALTAYNEEEVFGVEYLYRQAGREFCLTEGSAPMDDSVPIEEMDEGFIDDNIQAPSISEHLSTVGDGADEDIEEEPPEEEHDEEIAQQEEV